MKGDNDMIVNTADAVTKTIIKRSCDGGLERGRRRLRLLLLDIAFSFCDASVAVRSIAIAMI